MSCEAILESGRRPNTFLFYSQWSPSERDGILPMFQALSLLCCRASATHSLPPTTWLHDLIMLAQAKSSISSHVHSRHPCMIEPVDVYFLRRIFQSDDACPWGKLAAGNAGRGLETITSIFPTVSLTEVEHTMHSIT